MQHFLHDIEADPSFGLILNQSQVIEHVKMSEVGGIGVSVLVGHPVPLGGVSVPSANVFGLGENRSWLDEQA